MRNTTIDSLEIERPMNYEIKYFSRVIHSIYLNKLDSISSILNLKGKLKNVRLIKKFKVVSFSFKQKERERDSKRRKRRNRVLKNVLITQEI